MSGGNQGEHGQPGEHVGSVGEEAAKLLDALQDWAKDSGTSGLADQLRSANEHVATGGQDCTVCPVCRAIAKVREASPEVRTHLAVATSSLLQAAATLLEARAARPSAADPRVTKIDLDDEEV